MVRSGDQHSRRPADGRVIEYQQRLHARCSATLSSKGAAERPCQPQISEIYLRADLFSEMKFRTCQCRASVASAVKPLLFLESDLGWGRRLRSSAKTDMGSMPSAQRQRD